MSNALKRRVTELGERARALGIAPRKLLASLSPDELQVRVGMEDYLKAMAGLVPSVSELEIRHYEKLRDKFANKDVKAMKSLTNASSEGQKESENAHEDMPIDEGPNGMHSTNGASRTTTRDDHDGSHETSLGLD
jgi:hypothetical protein